MSPESSRGSLAGHVGSLDRDDLGSAEQELTKIVSKEPTPEFAAMMAAECRRLLEKLDDPQLRELSLAKMAGYGNEEIAQQLDCSVRTVGRRLRLIRKRWRQEIE